MNFKFLFYCLCFILILSKRNLAQNLQLFVEDSVCNGENLKFVDNNTQDFSRYWGFQPKMDITSPPKATLLEHFGNNLNTSVMTEPVYDGKDYYLFITNYRNSTLVRANYGSSYKNTPTVTNLGNFQNRFPANLEAVKIKKEGNDWLAFIVGYNGLYRLNFGADLNNNNPTYTDMGNIGNLAWPHELYLFKDKGNWYGFAANRNNNEITRYSFGNSLLNTPTAHNIRNFNVYRGTSGLELAHDKTGNFYLFVTAIFEGKIVRIDLGKDLMNPSPTFKEFHSQYFSNKVLRGILILKDCDNYVGYVTHESHQIIKLTFDNGLDGNISFENLSNLGGTIKMSNDISKSIMTETSAYAFATNTDNTIAMLEFPIYTSAADVFHTSNNTVPVNIKYSNTGWQPINYTLNFGEANQIDTCFNIYVKNCADNKDTSENTGCSFYIPNAFTPDGNNLNSTFKVFHDCPVDNWNLSIYNRWGEKLKEFTDPNMGWDGMYKGNKVPEGVYMYKLYYSFNKEGISKAGTFHLLYLH